MKVHNNETIRASMRTKERKQSVGEYSKTTFDVEKDKSLI